MKKVFIAVLAFVTLGGTVAAQTSEFKPGGKPIVKVFADYVNATDTKTINAFEISRAYLGYGYNFSENFSGKVVYDVATPAVGGSYFSGFLKNALVEYKNKTVTVGMGMISTTLFSSQENFWGKRYLQKTFQDLNGFGSSADLGISAKVNLLSNLTLDASVFNGEGYKSVQTDSIFLLAGGLTFEPIKGLIARVYTDYKKNNKNRLPNGVDMHTYNAFLGYTCKAGVIGGEFTSQKTLLDNTYSGISVYGTYNAFSKGSIFARYDNLTSKDDWNIAKDGQLYILGFEYAPVKGIKIAPNVQVADPKKDGAKTKTSYYLSLELSL